MKPICVPCQRFFKIKKTGFYFIEGMPRDNDTLPGTKEPENWKPYKVWVGDLWECQDCGSKVVVGCGGGPLAEHYETDFLEQVRCLNADQLQVNDC